MARLYRLPGTLGCMEKCTLQHVGLRYKTSHCSEVLLEDWLSTTLPYKTMSSVRQFPPDRHLNLLRLHPLVVRREVADVVFLYKIVNFVVVCPPLLERIAFRLPSATKSRRLFELGHLNRYYLQFSSVPRILRLDNEVCSGVDFFCNRLGAEAGDILVGVSLSSPAQYFILRRGRSPFKPYSVRPHGPLACARILSNRIRGRVDTVRDASNPSYLLYPVSILPIGVNKAEVNPLGNKAHFSVNISETSEFHVVLDRNGADFVCFNISESSEFHVVLDRNGADLCSIAHNSSLAVLHVDRPYSVTVCVNITETSEFHVVLARNGADFVCVNISETSEFHVVLDRNGADLCSIAHNSSLAVLHVDRPYSVTVCVNITETSEFHVVLARNGADRVCVNISETSEFHVVLARNGADRLCSIAHNSSLAVLHFHVVLDRNGADLCSIAHNSSLAVLHVDRPYSVTVCVNITETSEFHVVLARNGADRLCSIAHNSSLAVLHVDRPYSVTVCVNISETSEFHVVLARNGADRLCSIAHNSSLAVLHVDRPYSVTVCVSTSHKHQSSMSC
ncbi:hypothetical protein J6590_059431 [Homalodisca vitripennis]|nr:hypothetical protein J6590_059431 [Homalodisca vitripennis]